MVTTRVEAAQYLKDAGGLKLVVFEADGHEVAAMFVQGSVTYDDEEATFIAVAEDGVTVGELADEWLARKKQRTAPSHYRMLESAWRVHVQPQWGAVAVAEVDVLGVEAWIAGMGSKGSGATTVLRAHGVLSGILADAVKARRLAVNPAKGAENLPRKTGKRRVYLSADDVYRLAAESGDHRALVLVLAYCGLRWGEVVGLRVRDVEFLRRLSVSQNAVQLGVRHAVGPTKG
ncbi:MAG: site-specific integrase, partial [Mycobacterium sp.]